MIPQICIIKSSRALGSTLHMPRCRGTILTFPSSIAKGPCPSTSYERRRNPLVHPYQHETHDGQTARTGGEETAQKRRSNAPTLKQAGQANLMRFVEELRRCNGNGKSVPRRFWNPFCLHDVRGSHLQFSLTIPSFIPTTNVILLTWPCSRPTCSQRQFRGM